LIRFRAGFAQSIARLHHLAAKLLTTAMQGAV
jgi:hypothetical protein